MEFNKLKPGKKNDTDLTLKTSPNVVGDFNDEKIFLCNLLLSNTQILEALSNLYKWLFS